MAKTRTEIQAKYDATHRTTYSMKLHNENDKDVIDMLSSVPSTQGYIKQLIRNDINGTVSVSFSPAAMSILEDKAKESELSVSDLISVIVNEQLLRNCNKSVTYLKDRSRTCSAPDVAHWIKKSGDALYCSKCNMPSINVQPYCCGCGSKMSYEVI